MQNFKSQKGFTLIELLIVVAIIGIIAAIAIPNLLRSRMSANEAAAIGSCKTIAAAQTDYNNNSNPHTYAQTMTSLHTGVGAGDVSFMDSALGSGVKNGYTFFMQVGAFSVGSYWAWSACAWPISFRTTGVRSFYIDESGVVRGDFLNGGPGTVTLQAIK